MSNPTFSPTPFPPGYLLQTGPPGDPTDATPTPRVYASNKFNVSFVGGDVMSRYVGVTFPQFRDLLYRVYAWTLTGQVRFESTDFGYPGVPGLTENEDVAFSWTISSPAVDEDHLLEDRPFRVNDYSAGAAMPPWRGYTLQNGDGNYPYGTTNPLDPYTAFSAAITGNNPSYTDAGQLDARFLEWAYADTAGSETTWGGVSNAGFVSFDFVIRGSPFVTPGGSSDVPFILPTDALCVGSADTGDLAIIGKLTTPSDTTPVLGTRDGYAYHFIMEPSAFFGFDGTYDTSTGVLI